MNASFINDIVRRACKIATMAAINGRPVKVMWVPPQSGSQSMAGVFVVEQIPPLSGSDRLEDFL